MRWQAEKSAWSWAGQGISSNRKSVRLKQKTVSKSATLFRKKARKCFSTTSPFPRMRNTSTRRTPSSITCCDRKLRRGTPTSFHMPMAIWQARSSSTKAYSTTKAFIRMLQRWIVSTRSARGIRCHSASSIGCGPRSRPAADRSQFSGFHRRCIHSHCSGCSRIHCSTTEVILCIVPAMSIFPSVVARRLKFLAQFCAKAMVRQTYNARPMDRAIEMARESCNQRVSQGRGGRKR